MAIYPDGIKSWTNVADNTDHVMATHINEAYEEIIALEENAAKQSQLSNPNLLINPFFQINQRGFSSSSNAGYTVDGWRLVASGHTIEVMPDKSLKVTASSSAGVNFALAQPIEQFASFAGKTVTISAIITENTTTKGIRTRNNEFAGVPSDTIYGTGLFYRTLVLPSNLSNLDIGIQFEDRNADNGNYFIIKGMKVELGEISTLANDAPPKISMDLMDCQRYLLPQSSGTWYRADLVTTNSIQFTIPTPVTMRAHPSIIINGEMYIRSTSGANHTDFSFSQIVRSNAVIITATKSGHGLSDAYIILNNVLFSAEL